MSSWRSWWTALSVALVVQFGCGGESNEPDDDSGGGRADAGKSSSGSGGKGGRNATAGRGGNPGDAGEPGVGGSFGGSAGGGGTATAGRASGGGANVGNVGNVGGTGVSGSVSTGGTAGTIAGAGGSFVMPPFNWYCGAVAYGDGNCDCGCGTRDIDCDEDYEIDDCDTCNLQGSCSPGECPGRISEDDPGDCTPAPDGWKCPDYAYLDSRLCDCGCGVLDPDCEDETKGSCEICNLQGSCAATKCEDSSVNEDDNAKCDIPEGWTCPDIRYMDGVCTCGCGVLDADCSSASSDACESCYEGCAQTDCPGPIDAEDNTICTGVPVHWSCDPRFWDDGSLCHCGCGAVDPDCESDAGSACDRCNVEGSCSAQACPGTIDPENSAICTHPDPPDTWVCYRGQYADGYSCDCGCGALDPDCATNDIARCDQCGTCSSSCPGRVDPSDIGQCLEPPVEWECPPYRWGDGYSCDCGCGTYDPDCSSALVAACNACPSQGCSDYQCSDINPTDNARCGPTPPDDWSCSPSYYGDGTTCDCGCGAVDADCASANKSVCDICPRNQSCSPAGCSTINETNNAVCDP